MTVTADRDQGGAPPVPEGPAEPIRREVRPARPRDTSFDEFYHTNFRSLALQLCAYTGDLQQGQDLAQEAFCRAFARWSSVAGFDDPVAWVRRVAWNLATSRWRRLRIAQNYLRRQREEHVAGPTPDRVALTAALATLPAKHRRAIVLHHLADMPIGDIARQEGVAEGTVKSWLHRGRAALAAQLQDQPEEHLNA